jgi:hypothetical protein
VDALSDDLDPAALAWLDAEDGWRLALQHGRLIAQDPSGKLHPAPPRKLARGAAARQLLALEGVLVDHNRACALTVERWMLHSLPTPRAVLGEVWPDPAWRRHLSHAAVAVTAPSGEWDPRDVGLLLDVHPTRGLLLLRPSGHERWASGPQVFLPHPIVLDHLASLRRALHERWLDQALDQLYREIYHKPIEFAASAHAWERFRGPAPSTVEALARRARDKNFRVQGGYASTSLLEWGRPIQARFWIGEHDQDGVAQLGELQWVDAQGRLVALGGVGPVAFSEGCRMARLLSSQEPG